MKLILNGVILPIVLTLVLSSCVTTGIASMLLPESKGIEANVAIGKTNVQDKAVVSLKGEDKRQIADEIVNTETTTAESISNTNIPWWVALMVAFMRPIVILRDVINLIKGQ